MEKFEAYWKMFIRKLRKTYIKNNKTKYLLLGFPKSLDGKSHIYMKHKLTAKYFFNLNEIIHMKKDNKIKIELYN
jgi:RNase H-fold protein (predicted Holliday junction resolvase)